MMAVLDLTMNISEETEMFPDTPSVRMIPWNTIQYDGYNSEALFLSSHTGTHMDAPYHFYDKGMRIHQIPLAWLMGEAVLIHIPRGPDELITRHDIVGWESEHHTIEPERAVVFDTGWNGSREGEDFFKNPGLAEDAAEYLASKHTRLVGIDSLSIDAGCATSFPAHQILARSGAVNVENLVNLGRLEGTSFQFVILPLRLLDATASPVRAVAMV